MKITMNTMLMLVLACTMSAFAQTGMSSDSSMQKSDKATGKKMSMQGCIMEKDGKYLMTNKQHPDGIGLMSLEDLKPHVGHRVKVKGTMEKMDALSAAAMKSDDKMASNEKMKHDDTGMMEMKVSSMKMVSEHCDGPTVMDKTHK
ncbi:MAG: hypothetical protein M3O09_18465 [Acidobacteriota bacterium]|nr:hypothetical protein [Acidobacteriota bacterium]